VDSSMRLLVPLAGALARKELGTSMQVRNPPGVDVEGTTLSEISSVRVVGAMPRSATT